MPSIDNLNDLRSFYGTLPEGTTSDLIAEDLEAGNFDEATFIMPNGKTVSVTYTGDTAEGYVSPFEQQ